MPDRSEKESNKPYHHGDLRNALIQSAVNILQVEGLHGLTLRKTAARAGVSHSAPYRHFASKEALIAEICRIGFQELGDRGHRYIKKYRTASDRLKAYGLAYVEYASENPTHFRLMFGQSEMEMEDYPELHTTATSTFQLLVQLVADCQADGTFESGDPHKLAAANWAYVHGLAHLLVDQKLNWLLDTSRGKQTTEPDAPERARLLWNQMDSLLMQGLNKA
ncbi:MAG: TetR family transcriptional regulator [Spirochaetaceae bacterium]|nr:TetR family transcriptional regulator [Spirochaetaceae bacterium]|tara:strand:+ start:435435 stop:436097 length:663 start_codon:yes stop_codon:yes gene_type:complete